MVMLCRDLFIPPLIVSVIIGYQLSFYFLFQYYKNKKEAIQLNKILLAYGLIFGLSLSGHLIRILNLYYFEGTLLLGLTTKLMYTLLLASVISFFAIFSLKEFKTILNIRIPQFFMIILLIPLVVAWLFPYNSFEVIFYFMIIVPIPALYILILQFKLIKLSTGQIKKRLKLITIGAALCLGAFLIGSYIVSILIIDELFLLSQGIAIPLFLFGLLIILLGVYDFPAFLEFGWRDNLIALFIVNRHNFDILYSYRFKGKEQDYQKIESIDSKLSESDNIFSRGIIGIESVISNVTKTEEKNIDKIRQGDLLILLKRGDEPISNLIIGLFIKREMKSANYILKQIKKRFQENYKDVLINLDSLKRFEGLFRSFDIFLSDILK